MKTLHKSIFLFLPLITLFFFHPIQGINAQHDSISPTPIYDPLEEPPLPPNPTEWELGRNLYWHWCMTCHGDRGQGLTDEFRSIWEPEHQNCWGRGCHAGRPGDEGFPIPTVVPALVNETHLAQFESLQDLSDFLEATHPPQSPGVLEGEEYHAIALFVFTINERSPINIRITHIPTLALTPTPMLAPQKTASISLPVYAYAIAIFTVLIIGVFILARRTRLHD